MPAETTLAGRLAEQAAERFLRYVRIDTQSDEESDTYPSTEKQLDLLRLLRDELEQAGLADAAIHVGHELITTDGTTLLGADDKAGVAEIMAAAAHLAAHPEIPHGPVKIAF